MAGITEQMLIDIRVLQKRVEELERKILDLGTSKEDA